MAAAAERAGQTRDLVTQLVLQNDPGHLTVALQHMDAAYASLPELAPGGAVTGQHLRLVVAFLLERRFARRGQPGGDWAPAADWEWAADDALSTADSGYAVTRPGMVAAVRFLTDYAETYGQFFPELIAHMLSAPLQVLLGLGNSQTGEISAGTQNFTPGGAPARHTIVLVSEHYLATRARSAAAPASTVPPTTTATPPPSEGSSGGSMEVDDEAGTAGGPGADAMEVDDEAGTASGPGHVLAPALPPRLRREPVQPPTLAEALNEQRRQSYREYRAGLAGSSRVIQADSREEDSFFGALRVLAPKKLAAHFGGGVPSVSQMRAAIARAVEASFADYQAYLGRPDAQQHGGYFRALFPDLMALEHDPAGQQWRLAAHLSWIRALGNWADDRGNAVVEIAADLWQLPLTTLGPDYPQDFGPPAGEAPRGYLLYDDSGYLGVAHDADDRARPAAQLLPLLPEPGVEIPASIDGDALVQEFRIAFDQLHPVAVAAVADQTGLVTRLADLYGQFNDAFTAAATAADHADEAALAHQIRRMSGLYQDLGDVLRDARASAAAAASGPAPPAGAAGASGPRKRGRSPEEEQGEEGHDQRQAKRGRLAGPQDAASPGGHPAEICCGTAAGRV